MVKLLKTLGRGLETISHFYHNLNKYEKNVNMNSRINIYHEFQISN
jgi:hypothetical protein